ncbi:MULTISPECIES: tetratricopeptide repeat protein [Burkholderia]|uniref:TPR domain-containing protein n=1 Tax=Burkholderia aenigmatica TaxID=2015348 RepID=A0ABY6XQW3_9BURK|nr:MULTISPECIES: tetratricopeptide repeat protein [Burkholderia]VWC50567.1 TPR domain-containing protein [Burkholderia aenigmatica]VWD06097.1 TPR domain-containing protein [Burkholderia aenigmatica]
MDTRSGWGKARRLLAGAWLLAAGMSMADAAVRSDDDAIGQSAPGEVNIVAGDVTTGGIVVAPGRVATPCHRLAGRPAFDIASADGRRRPARLVAGNQDRDICIVEATDLDVAAVPLTARSPESATTAYLAGARFGRHDPVALRVCCHAWAADGGIHSGVLASPNPAPPPEPGAGVYDEQGNLIGMVGARADNAASLYMVLPVEWIATVAARMPAVDLPLEATAWMSQARAYAVANDVDGLIRHDLAWTAARPHSAWAWNNLGNAYRTSRLPDRGALSLAAYLRSVESDPSYAFGWTSLGNTYAELGQMDRALDAFHAGMRADPSDAMLPMNLGIAYLRRGDKADARPLFEQGVHALSGSRQADAWSLLASTQPDAQATIGVLHDGLQAFPDDARLWYALGRAQYDLGHLADAIASYQHALSAQKGGDPAATALIQGALTQAYALQGQSGNASSAMHSAVEAAPDNAEYWLRLGALYMAQSNYVDALSALDRSIKLNDGDARAWRMHGVTLAQLGQHAQAVASFRRAVALDESLAAGWVVLAGELNQVGQPDEASAAAAHALKLDPSNRLAREAMGIAAIRGKRPDAAVGIFEELNRTYPGDAQVIANLAVAYRRTGRVDDAVQLYRRVKTLDPTLAQRLYDEELKGVATP